MTNCIFLCCSGKRVQIRKPIISSSDVAPLRQTSRPVIISSSQKKKPPRPLRERLVHLLALKPYRKPELLVRLIKDGLPPQDKEMLDSLLQQVCAFPFLFICILSSWKLKFKSSALWDLASFVLYYTDNVSGHLSTFAWLTACASRP